MILQIPVDQALTTVEQLTADVLEWEEVIFIMLYYINIYLYCLHISFIQVESLEIPRDYFAAASVPKSLLPCP